MAEIRRALRKQLDNGNVTDVLIMRSHPLLEKNAAGIGAMNLRMADRAGLILIGLVMERGSARRGEVHRSGMALQAEGIDIIACQQARVGRPMRKVARGASLRLERRMLVYKWAGGLGVAFGADSVLICAGLEELVFKCPVGVMTIAAFHEPLIDLVMEGLSEGRLGIGMAAVAELRLGRFEQICIGFCVVAAVASDATHASRAMRSSFEVGVCILVASEALAVGSFGGGLGELEDLGGIAA